MTDSHPHPNPPTQKQLAYLRDLSLSRGMTFAVPRSSAEASAEIERLRRRRRSSHADRAAERLAARRLADRWGPATQVRPEEVEGYGANCRWKR